MPKEEVKLNVEKADDYRTLGDILNSNNVEWYSCEDKEQIPLRVAKRLHALLIQNV